MEKKSNNQEYLRWFNTGTQLGLTKLKQSTLGLMSRVFANGQGDRGSIPGRVMPKTQKMVFDVGLLNTQHYKVSVKVKVEQSRERSSALPCTSM